ncbi:MAG: hypothetical protein IPN50_09110 [Sphingomonadales bacterium]|nr:hypothetical protein [Sphingomonadales bacterium]
MTYTVVATNAGNITQSAVTVSDPMLTPGSTTCATLRSGRHMHPHRYLCRPAERCRRGQD